MLSISMITPGILLVLTGCLLRPKCSAYIVKIVFGQCRICRLFGMCDNCDNRIQGQGGLLLVWVLKLNGILQSMETMTACMSNRLPSCDISQRFLKQLKESLEGPYCGIKELPHMCGIIG